MDTSHSQLFRHHTQGWPAGGSGNHDLGCILNANQTQFSYEERHNAGLILTRLDYFSC